MKLADQSAADGGLAGLGEAFAITRGVGWEPKRLIDLFVETRRQQRLKMRADMIVAMIEGRDPGPTTFSIANAREGPADHGRRAGTAKGADMPRASARWPARGSQRARGWAAATARRQSVYWAEPRQADKIYLTLAIGATMSVTLAQASTIVDVALKKARDNNLAPLTVAVLDAGGHLVAFKREDKSGILRFDIAVGKA